MQRVLIDRQRRVLIDDGVFRRTAPSSTSRARQAPRGIQLRLYEEKAFRDARGTPRRNRRANGVVAATAAADDDDEEEEEEEEEEEQQEEENKNGVLFFAYGALMDPSVMQKRLSRESKLHSSRTAVAVAFAGEKRAREREKERERAAREEEPASASPAPSLAVAFCHRGGWATLVDLPRARSLSQSLLWRLVPGSEARKKEEKKGPFGGWSEDEDGESEDDDDDPSSFVSGACFSSPAHGALYSLSSTSDLEILAEKEGGYSLRKVEVRVRTGKSKEKRNTITLDAFAFVSSRGLCLRYPLPPREEYLAKMIRGSEAAGINEQYKSWLERVPSARSKTLDERYAATPAGAAAAAAAVAVFAAVVYLVSM